MFTIYAWASGSTSQHLTSTVEHAALWVADLAEVSDRVVITHKSVYGQIEVQNKAVSIIGGDSAEMSALYFKLKSPKPVTRYATDGKCHNAQTGTYGHECGKPAKWLGTTATGFTSGFCEACKESGSESHTVTAWHRC